MSSGMPEGARHQTTAEVPESSGKAKGSLVSASIYGPIDASRASNVSGSE
jgi:hypothetical protein